MSSHLIAPILVLALAGGTCAYLFLGEPAQVPARVGPVAPNPQRPAADPVVRPAAAAPEARAPESPRPRPLTAAEAASHPPGSLLELPDGTWLPVLNGALGAPPLLWESDRPWSPVVRLKTDPRGYQWYVHEDGTESITQLVFDSRVEGKVPATNAFHPKSRALPVLHPSDIKKQ